MNIRQPSFSMLVSSSTKWYVSFNQRNVSVHICVWIPAVKVSDQWYHVGAKLVCVSHTSVFVRLFSLYVVCVWQCRALQKRLSVAQRDRDKLQQDLSSSNQSSAQLRVSKLLAAN